MVQRVMCEVDVGGRLSRPRVQVDGGRRDALPDAAGLSQRESALDHGLVQLKQDETQILDALGRETRSDLDLDVSIPRTEAHQARWLGVCSRTDFGDLAIPEAVEARMADFLQQGKAVARGPVVIDRGEIVNLLLTSVGRELLGDSVFVSVQAPKHVTVLSDGATRGKAVAAAYA